MQCTFGDVFGYLEAEFSKCEAEAVKRSKRTRSRGRSSVTAADIGRIKAMVEQILRTMVAFPEIGVRCVGLHQTECPADTLRSCMEQAQRQLETIYCERLRDILDVLEGGALAPLAGDPYFEQQIAHIYHDLMPMCVANMWKSEQHVENAPSRKENELKQLLLEVRGLEEQLLLEVKGLKEQGATNHMENMSAHESHDNYLTDMASYGGLPPRNESFPRPKSLPGRGRTGWDRSPWNESAPELLNARSTDNIRFP